MRRTLATALVAASLLTAGCGGDADPGARAGEGGDDLPALRAPERPQRLDADTALQVCPSDGERATRRVASIVLPADFDSGQTDELPRDRSSEPDATCGYSVVNGDYFRPEGKALVTLTFPARVPLAEAARAQARGRRVDLTAPAGGADGVERGRWRIPAGYAREGFDVVAVQSDGVRLALLTPVGASPAEVREGREAWRLAMPTLAVRSAADSDGDPDADSDTGPPTGDTTTLRPVAAEVDDAARFRRLTCRGRDPVTVSLLVPERLTAARGCYTAREGPRAPYDYDEENISVETEVEGPLWEEYQERLAAEAPGGDEATSNLEYDAEVEVAGLPAESLVFNFSNDGQPYEGHLVQVAGVRVSWQVRPDEWGPQADELPTVLDSLDVRPE